MRDPHIHVNTCKPQWSQGTRSDRDVEVPCVPLCSLWFMDRAAEPGSHSRRQAGMTDCLTTVVTAVSARLVACSSRMQMRNASLRAGVRLSIHHQA